MSDDNENEKLRELLHKAHAMIDVIQAERNVDKQAREKAERGEEEEKKRRKAAEEKLRPTSFREYLYSCHTLLLLRVQRDRRLTTKGSVPAPWKRLCPTSIKPWHGFLTIHNNIFTKVDTYLPSNDKHFACATFITKLGSLYCERLVGSEKDLEVYERMCVETHLSEIIAQLRRDDDARSELNLAQGIMFKNHANTLSDGNQEVKESLQDVPIHERSYLASLDIKPRQADQVCVHKDLDGTQTACMVVEYKAPHKLTTDNLRAGLGKADLGSMDVLEDVINRTAIQRKAKNDSSDEADNLGEPEDVDETDATFIYKSEWLVGAALIQIYDYMIKSGLEYSYLTTGESFVFLRIKEEEPHNLYYHLAQPSSDALSDETENPVLLTAISQALTCCLLAMKSTPRGQGWRLNAVSTANVAAIDYEIILRNMPESDVEESPKTPGF